MSAEGFDWLTASTEARKVLYRQTKQLMDRSGLTWSRLYREALGETYSPGQGYEDNFRAGRIARTKAGRLFRWLATHHPDVAQAIEAELGVAALSDGEVWDQFLARHGRFSGVEVISLAQARPSIVAFAGGEPVAATHIRLGEPFCFRAHSTRVGAALALQSLAGRWYVLPLGPEALFCTVARGAIYLPRNESDGEPIALAEEQDAGRHSFAFIIADASLIAEIAAMLTAGVTIPAAQLARIVGALEAHPSAWELLRINVLIVS